MSVCCKTEGQAVCSEIQIYKVQEAVANGSFRFCGYSLILAQGQRMRRGRGAEVRRRHHPLPLDPPVKPEDDRIVVILRESKRPKNLFIIYREILRVAQDDNK